MTDLIIYYLHRFRVIAVSIILCVSVAFVTQHAKRMRRIILASVSCPTLSYFSTSSHTKYDLQKKIKRFVENIIFNFPKTFFWNIAYCQKDSLRFYHKARPWSGPEGSRNLRFLDFMTTTQDGCKVVSLTHRPPLSPGNTPDTHFC